MVRGRSRRGWRQLRLRLATTGLAPPAVLRRGRGRGWRRLCRLHGLGWLGRRRCCRWLRLRLRAAHHLGRRPRSCGGGARRLVGRRSRLCRQHRWRRERRISWALSRGAARGHPWAAVQAAPLAGALQGLSGRFPVPVARRGCRGHTAGSRGHAAGSRGRPAGSGGPAAPALSGDTGRGAGKPRRDGRSSAPSPPVAGRTSRRCDPGLRSRSPASVASSSGRPGSRCKARSRAVNDMGGGGGARRETTRRVTLSSGGRRTGRAAGRSTLSRVGANGAAVPRSARC